MSHIPNLVPAEFPAESSASTHTFLVNVEKPLRVTNAAVELYSVKTIQQCQRILAEAAVESQGIHYLQVFECGDMESLCLFEGYVRDAVYACLESEYHCPTANNRSSSKPDCA